MLRMLNRAPLLDQHRVLYQRFTETALVVADGGIAQEAQRIGDQQRETVDATTPGVGDGSRREKIAPLRVELALPTIVLPGPFVSERSRKNSIPGTPPLDELQGELKLTSARKFTSATTRPSMRLSCAFLASSTRSTTAAGCTRL
jgi:hypothetical protein